VIELLLILGWALSGIIPWMALVWWKGDLYVRDIFMLLVFIIFGPVALMLVGMTVLVEVVMGSRGGPLWVRRW
jgi:hypothetical protein